MKIMILGAGVYQVPLIRSAAKLGYETYAVSIPGPYPGFREADHAVYVDTRDGSGILRIAREEKIDGICTTGTDVAVSSIGYVCDQMGLCGISHRAAAILCDKALMKEAFLKGGVSCAAGRRVYSFREAQSAAREIGYPVVVKRVDSSGSRGITISEREEDLKKAYLLAREKTQHEYVIVEKKLEGTEIGVDGVVKDGKVVFLAPHGKFVYTADRRTIPGGHSFPYRASEALLADIRRQMQLVADASGADNCCLNADVMVSGDRAYIIEAGGRCGATCIPELISAYYGFDYYESIVRQAAGEKVEYPDRPQGVPCMAKLLMSRKEGVITSIDREKIGRLRENGADIRIDYPEGARVYAMSDGTDRLGSVLLHTEDEKELDRVMAEVRSCITVDGINLQQLWNG